MPDAEWRIVVVTTTGVRSPHLNPLQYTSSAQFTVTCEAWTALIGFSELVGFTSQVEHQEYAYNTILGHQHTKQYGRNVPPSLTLRRGLDARGFAQLMAWHTMARTNNPAGKVTAVFTISEKSGAVTASCVLDRAWCSKLELDSVKAGSSDIVTIAATIECDSVILL